MDYEKKIKFEKDLDKLFPREFSSAIRAMINSGNYYYMTLYFRMGDGEWYSINFYRDEIVHLDDEPSDLLSCAIGPPTWMDGGAITDLESRYSKFSTLGCTFMLMVNFRHSVVLRKELGSISDNS